MFKIYGLKRQLASNPLNMEARNELIKELGKIKSQAIDSEYQAFLCGQIGDHFGYVYHQLRRVYLRAKL